MPIYTYDSLRVPPVYTGQSVVRTPVFVYAKTKKEAVKLAASRYDIIDQSWLTATKYTQTSFWEQVKKEGITDDQIIILNMTPPKVVKKRVKISTLTP